MNNKEKSIILDTYKNIYYTHTIIDIDKSDTIREFKLLLNALNLKVERYTIENDIICEKHNIQGTHKEIYKMIFDTFLKYNVYVNYDLSEIDTYYDDLQYQMTDEEIKCHKARLNYINS